MHPTLGQRAAARPPAIRNIRENLPLSQIRSVPVIGDALRLRRVRL